MQEGGQTEQSNGFNDIPDFDCPNTKYNNACRTKLSKISEVEVDYSELTINSPKLKASPPSKEIAKDSPEKSRFNQEFHENADYQMESIPHSENYIATSIEKTRKRRNSH